MLSQTAILSRAVTVSATTIAITVGTLGQAIAQTLNGAGATFPAPLYQSYFDTYKKATGVTVNYNSVGSGAGIKQFISETVDFGATDVPPSSSEKGQMKRGVLLIPTAGGAVAVAYNVSGVSNLQISRANLAKIFSGEIKNWKQVDSKLPDKAIRVVVRADGSGTTEIFTSHLSALSSTFRQKIGASKEPNWGFQVLKGAKNDGVAALIKQTDGSIGYIQDTYARKNEGATLKTAKIQNKKGTYVEPSLAEANKALGTIKFNSDFTAEISDPADGYPIVGITWLMLQTDYKDDNKATAVKNLVKWILGAGQQINDDLEYTKIPSSVIQKALSAVNNIK
jgi:phosphate transport system substrate-binding protein